MDEGTLPTSSVVTIARTRCSSAYPSKMEKLKELLNSPLAGLSPWIVMSLVSGSNGRLELSVALALAISALLVVLSLSQGSSLKLLELSDTIFFAGLALIGLLATPGTTRWLEQWAGEISNLALVVIAILSIAIRRPFTLSYAREMTDRELWENPEFIRTNYVITWAWAVAFVIQAASGAFGDVVLDNPNNLWTGWIIQTVPIVVAIQFTVWYPKYVTARARQEQGLSTDPPPPLSDFLVPLTGWLIPIGVIALIVGGSPWWVGVGFIVAGAALTNLFHRDRRSRAKV